MGKNKQEKDNNLRTIDFKILDKVIINDIGRFCIKAQFRYAI